VLNWGSSVCLWKPEETLLLQIIWRFDLYYSPGEMEAMNWVKYVKRRKKRQDISWKYSILGGSEDK